MKRYEIINSIIRKRGYERYLEIGTWMGECISKIECAIRHGVDPGDKPVRVEDCKGKWAPVARQLQADPRMHFDHDTGKSGDEFFWVTSDKFFEMLLDCYQSGNPFIPIQGEPLRIGYGYYDFIFIDGCHTHEQSMRDFDNALPWLQGKGMIMLHDTLPASEVRAKPDGMDNGEVWKTVVVLRCLNPDLEIITVDTDMGCTLVRRSELQQAYSDAPLEVCLQWDYMTAHRKELLNIISVDEFKEMME